MHSLRAKREPKKDLPTFYYHAHFLEMLDFVYGHYTHVLSQAEHQFKQDFDTLSFPAQCLYVRLVNRRGRLFNTASLRYAEIDKLSAVVGAAQPKICSCPHL